MLDPTTDFPAVDASDPLPSRRDVAAYLSRAFEQGDLEGVLSALREVTRAHGISKLSRDSGVSRKGLYKAFAPAGNPELRTVIRVLDGMGLQLFVNSMDATESGGMSGVSDASPSGMCGPLKQLALSYGMAKLGRETGLSPRGIAGVFEPEGNPELATLLRVLHVLGLQARIAPR